MSHPSSDDGPPSFPDGGARDGGARDGGARDDGARDDGGPAIPLMIGRADKSSPVGWKFSWPGSSVAIRFTGTSVGVQLTDPGNYFNVLIDGNNLLTLSTSAGTKVYPLASGLPDSTHELILYRRTEGRSGNTQLRGWVFDNGRGMLAPPKAASRRIELIGDSISCGYGNEGAGPGCTFTPATENHYLSYGALAARELQAEITTVAWSGKGMYRDAAGDPSNTMPEMYTRTLSTSTTLWTFGSWTPDVVVINLGTNDFARGDPGQPYLDAYLAFVQRLRMQYPPSTQIICALGPMLSGSNLAAARAYIQTGVVDKLRKQGDNRISFLEFPTQTGALGYGCLYHPSLQTHQQMADFLVQEVKKQMAW